MERTMKHGIGKRVKIVPQHWLRGGEIGQIVGFEQRGQNNWLVKFERRFTGGGIDGDKLWLGQREFVALTDEDVEDIIENASSGVDECQASDFVPVDLNGSTSH